MNNKIIGTIGSILGILVVAGGFYTHLNTIHASAKDVADVNIVLTSLVDRAEVLDLRRQLTVFQRDCGVKCDQCGPGIQAECERVKDKIKKLEGKL